MALTGAVDTANARVDLFVDWTAVAGTQTTATLYRHVGGPNADPQYVRGLFGTSLLGEQAYVSDHEAPLDQQLWYTAVSSQSSTALTAGPFTITSSGYVWLKDPGRPWADLRLDLCVTPSNADPAACDTPLVTDTFSRTSASGWGTADSGQVWSTTGGVAADYSVSGGTGRHTSAAANVIRAATVPSTTADVNVVTDFAMQAVPVGDSAYFFSVARFTDATHFYFNRVQVSPVTGAMTLTLRKRNVSETQLGSSYTLTGLTMSPGVWFRSRLLVKGNTIRTRVWPRDGAEPTEWQIITTDNDLTTAGSTGLRSVLGVSVTSPLPFVFQFDNYSVTDAGAAVPDDLVWVGFRDKVRAMDAGLFPVLDTERPADVFARRKDITTGALFLSRSLDSITLVYELFTAGGPLLVQVPDVYGMYSPYGNRDRYYQPDDLTEGYISEDQRKPPRLWTVPLTSTDFPLGLPQGTDTANWCVVKDTYATFADLTATGYTWGQVAQGAASSVPASGLYGGGTYGGGIYGG